eukprot:TRINITY_DN72334_c0_g1_i1.p1 TRINITY_DN72334_c0_g1~~TRINITY_DN72334_c0_g1_i1.p1  ORF type:complete len:266 (+),score=38.39 TRINITY_DN72334_c0_g1_i1:62-859(+)
MGATSSSRIVDVEAKRRKVPKRFTASIKGRIHLKWQRRDQASQFFAVVRHAERADGLFAFTGDMRWCQTDDYRHWQFDPPLSNCGHAQAKEMAATLQDASERQGSPINVVISSPYARCIQTAVAICQELPRARLLVDRSLGEVFGPSVMGETEPICPVRPLSDVMEYCEQQGVTFNGSTLGKWPSWPEDLKAARRRFANRFLTYLHRASKAKRNFVLVTHGDCVGAALAMMPSHAEQRVERIEYGGMFVCWRKLEAIKGCFPPRS